MVFWAEAYRTEAPWSTWVEGVSFRGLEQSREGAWPRRDMRQEVPVAACDRQARSNKDGKKLQKALGLKWADLSIWENRVGVWRKREDGGLRCLVHSSAATGLVDICQNDHEGKTSWDFGYLAETKWWHADDRRDAGVGNSVLTCASQQNTYR